MSFNNHFNFRRFSNLLRQDLLFNKTKYLFTILGLGLVGYFLSCWFLSSHKTTLVRFHDQINVYYLTCFTFYMMGAGVFIGTAFPDLTDKIKTANYLLLPGSVMEKFLVQFFTRIVLFLPVALGIFWIVIRLAKASLISDPEIIYNNQFFDPSDLADFKFRLLVTREGALWSTLEILVFIFGFFSYGAFLFAGTTYFKKYPLVKTVVFSFIMMGSYFLLAVFLSYVFYPDETNGFRIHLLRLQITESIGSTEFFLLLVAMFSWIFFLLFAYFKLKEREA